MDELFQYAREFSDALRKHRYEVSDEGILLPAQKLWVRGVFTHNVNGEDERQDCNLVPTEGLNYLLDSALHGSSQLTTFYVAPFKGNVTPASTWTAANVTSNSTEATEYNEAARVVWNEAASSGGSITSDASKAAFTINASITVYGAFLVSASAKSATTGTLIAASRFSASRALVNADVLNIGYTLTITSS